jgi:hypothetical protein
MKLLAISLLLLANAAQSEPNCWAANVVEPISGEDLPIHHPKHRSLHVAMDVIEAMLRPNPGLLAIPEVRLRFKRDVLGAIDAQRMPREAVIHAQGFGPKAWGRGPCEVIPQAERLGARAGISVFINLPTATMNRWEHDEQLVTYLEGDVTPSFQGWPTYRECAVLSQDRRLPWIPVTVAEMLAYFDREQQRKLADWDRSQERALQPFDLAAAEREAARIQSQNAKAAELMLMVARQRKASEANYHAQLRQQRQMLVDELAHLRATRDGMSAAKLAEQYQVGSGRHRLTTPMDAGRPPKRVVKLDPTFPWDGKNRGRIQLITVCAPQLERNPAYHPPMRDAVAAIDFARLAALLN